MPQTVVLVRREKSLLAPEKKENRLSLGADVLYVFPERPSKVVKRFLNFIDCVLSLFVVTPLVVAFWRGTWDFLDQNIEIFPNWHTFLFGSMLHVFFTLLRETLHSEFAIPDKGDTVARKIRRFFVTKLYTYAFGVACIMQWRGGWGVMQDYYGFSKVVLAANFALLIPLAFLKGLRNLLCAPMMIITDVKEFTFSFPTRFRTEVSFSNRLVGQCL